MYEEIGKKIKKLRSDNGYTLADISNLTNLSVGFLSQLERGKTTVAIDSLRKIASVMKVDISHFFEVPPKKEKYITRSYEREIMLMEKDNYIQYQLSGDISDKSIFPRLIEILPNKEEEILQPFTHEGEEFIYILEGILTYYCNGEYAELYPGDSAHIHSTVPHNWVNNTNKTVKLVMVSIPNEFREKDK